MSWRAYLADRPVRGVEILAGKPSLLAVWLKSDQVSYLDLQTGQVRGESTIPPLPDVRTGAAWQTFLDALKSPNTIVLPSVKTPAYTLLNSPDGTFRMLRTGAESLICIAKDHEAPLTFKQPVTPLAAFDLDRTSGMIAALEPSGMLHVFQQDLPVTSFATGLKIQPDVRPTLIITGSGTSIFVSDGMRIAVFSATGKLRRVMEIPYLMGTMRPSSNGKMLLTTDVENGVLRIYHGDTFALMYQRFAVDLVAESRRTAAASGALIPTGAIGATAINTRGVIAFTVGGMVCVTSLSGFQALLRQTSDV